MSGELEPPLGNQARQIALEERRLDLEVSLAGSNFDVTRQVIAAGVQDRRDARKSRLILVLGLSALAAAVIVFLVLRDKDALLVDLVKIGAGVALGWGAKSASVSRKEDGPPAGNPL